MSALGKRGSTRKWRRIRLMVLERDGYRCHWCALPANTVDHVIARVRGGSDDPGNLVACCGPCNYRRGQAESRTARQPAPPSRQW